MNSLNINEQALRTFLGDIIMVAMNVGDEDGDLLDRAFGGVMSILSTDDVEKT